MPLFIKLAFAGLGSLLLHWGIGIAIIFVCLIIEFAGAWLISMMPFLSKPIVWLQKWVLFVAVAIALVLLGEYIGARDLAARCEAKAVVIEHTVDKAVTDANGNPAKKDKWETDQ